MTRTTRFEFTIKQKRAMAERSGGLCEAGKFGTYAMYGMGDRDLCLRKATEFDHIVADGLKRTKVKSIEEGAHVCAVHHKVKTHGHDSPKINKAKRLADKAHGIAAPKAKIANRPFTPRLKESRVSGAAHQAFLEKRYPQFLLKGTGK